MRISSHSTKIDVKINKYSSCDSHNKIQDDEETLFWLPVPLIQASAEVRHLGDPHYPSDEHIRRNIL